MDVDSIGATDFIDPLHIRLRRLYKSRFVVINLVRHRLPALVGSLYVDALHEMQMNGVNR